MGYDPAELLEEIKQKEAEIARLAPGCLTEEKLKLTIAAVQELHTPERVQHSMAPTAASALCKLEAALIRFTAERQRNAELVASLTEEERQLILDMRRKAGR